MISPDVVSKRLLVLTVTRQWLKWYCGAAESSCQLIRIRERLELSGRIWAPNLTFGHQMWRIQIQLLQAKKWRVASISLIWITLHQCWNGVFGSTILAGSPQIQLWCWHCAPYKCSYYYYRPGICSFLHALFCCFWGRIRHLRIWDCRT